MTTPTTSPVLWPDLDQIPLAGNDGGDPQTPLQGFMRSARELGPIHRVAVPGFEMVIVAGGDLAAELVDEGRFAKHVGFGMEAYREVTGDGLFTAYNDEPNWRLAHDILLPAFTLEAMRSYHPAMIETVRELVNTWRQSEGAPVDVVGDMTKLALESIGRAGFGYSFDSFQGNDFHPFVAAMIGSLQYSTKMPEEQQRERAGYEANVAYMHELVDEVVARRRASGDTSTSDLLGVMLNSRSADGSQLDAENIRNQITTFLIAGFGTSAGLMSFVLHFLSTHPEVLAAVRAEIAQVVGDETAPEPSYEQVTKLRYLRRVLDEALRLWPPAAVFMREAREDTLLGGRYPMNKGAWALVLTPMLHRDPAIWGEDAESFDPSRFSPDAVRSRPAHAFKPFGTGPRACIGRQFALHEATLAITMILQRFDLAAAPDYELTVGEPGFFMPAGFTLSLSPREPEAAGPAAAVSPEIAAAAAVAGCPYHAGADPA